MYLVVGLGNPGRQYTGTRHNLGFTIIDKVSSSFLIPIEREKFKSLWGMGQVSSKRVLLVKPQTFMNLSGNAIRRWIDYYDLSLENSLIVYDDLDLSLGKLRFAYKGGSGGHKGIESVIQMLGTLDIPRLRIGIGRPRYEEATDKFVLSSFYPDEAEIVDEVINKAALAVETWINEGITKAMNKFH